MASKISIHHRTISKCVYCRKKVNFLYFILFLRKIHINARYRLIDILLNTQCLILSDGTMTYICCPVVYLRILFSTCGRSYNLV